MSSDSNEVDIFVNFNRKTFRIYNGLKYYLEELIGKKVDLVCENTLKSSSE